MTRSAEETRRVLTNEDTLEEAKMRYNAERLSRMTPYVLARYRLDADACHDVALDMGLDHKTFAELLDAPYQP